MVPLLGETCWLIISSSLSADNVLRCATQDGWRQMSKMLSWTPWQTQPKKSANRLTVRPTWGPMSNINDRWKGCVLFVSSFNRLWCMLMDTVCFIVGEQNQSRSTGLVALMLHSGIVGLCSAFLTTRRALGLWRLLWTCCTSVKVTTRHYSLSRLAG